jgi:hypothetical protein
MESVAVLGWEKSVCHMKFPLLGTSTVSSGWVDVEFGERTTAWAGEAIVSELKRYERMAFKKKLENLPQRYRIVADIFLVS